MSRSSWRLQAAKKCQEYVIETMDSSEDEESIGSEMSDTNSDDEKDAKSPVTRHRAAAKKSHEDAIESMDSSDDEGSFVSESLFRASGWYWFEGCDEAENRSLNFGSGTSQYWNCRRVKNKLNGWGLCDRDYEVEYCQRFVKNIHVWLANAKKAIDERRLIGEAKFSLSLFFAQEVLVSFPQDYICQIMRHENGESDPMFKYKAIVFEEKGHQVICRRALIDDCKFKECKSTMYIPMKAAAHKLLVELPNDSDFQKRPKLYLRLWPYELATIYNKRQADFDDLQRIGLLEGCWFRSKTKESAELEQNFSPSELEELLYIPFLMECVMAELSTHILNKKLELEYRRQLVQSMHDEADQLRKRARIERYERARLENKVDFLRAKVKEKDWLKWRQEQLNAMKTKHIKELKSRSQILESAIDDLKRKVGAKTQVPLDDEALERYRDHCLGCCKRLASNVTKMGPSVQQRGIQIQVPTNFSLSNVMAEWYATWKTNDEDDKVANTLFSDHFAGISKLVLSEWCVTFKSNDFVGTKAMIEESTSVDEGGPSREFFSRFFEQLGALTVDGIPLFEMTKYGYIPLPDDFLNQKCDEKPTKEAVSEQIELYFRAIGRIFAYCFLHHITIPSNALPTFYWNILLCGLFPKNKLCSITLLIDGAAPLLDIEAEASVDDRNNGKDLETKLFKMLGINVTDDVNVAKRIARETIHDFFVEGRSMFLKSMRNGLSLGGEIDFPSMFGLVPPQVIKQVFLARPTITVDDLFGVMDFVVENLSHLTDDRRQKVQSELAKDEEKHGLFQMKLHEAFSKKASEDPTFLNKFVHLCTGQAYLPDPKVHTDFRITLEFNHTECRHDHCPSVHTCDNLIKIPSTCYDLDMEVFFKKLVTTMELAQFGFDMA